MNNELNELFKPVDAKAEIRIATDRMSAAIFIIAPENNGADLRMQEMKRELQRAGVVYGIRDDILSGLALVPVYNKAVEVAFGKHAINGEDARIDYFFKVNHTKAPTLREDGTVDYWNLDLLSLVKKGDKLCQLIPPTDGTYGQNVLGEMIQPKKGKPVQLPYGKNVIQNDEKTMCYAAIDGSVSVYGNQINVNPCYNVQGDVDLRVGNIEFNGDVVVSGNVLEGFKITATRNITVYGNVENATLNAGGDIQVNGGIYGNNTRTIQCKGNLTCKFIENMRVISEGDINCNYISNSNVICENSIILQGDKASLVGGEYTILKELICRDIGCESETIETKVDIGNYGTIMMQKNELEKRFSELIRDENRTSQIIDYLTEKEKEAPLSNERKELMRDAIQTKTRLLAEKGSIYQQIQKLEIRMVYSGLQQATVSNAMYVGSSISLCNSIFIPKTVVKHTRFIFNKETNKIEQTSI